MKTIFVPFIKQVPEWKQCYYDTKTMSKLIKLSEQYNKIQQNIKKNIHQLFLKQSKTNKQKMQIYRRLKMEYLSRELLELTDIRKQINKRFYSFTYHEMETIYFFVQYKYFQIQAKFERLLNYQKVVDIDDKYFIALLENSYIQVHYLKRMIRYNQSQQRSCIKQFQLNLFSYETPPSQLYSRRLNRMQRQIDHIEKSMEKMYLVHQITPQKYGIKELLTIESINRDQVNQKAHRTNAYKLGFIMGILFVILAAVIFLKEYHNINLDSNKSYASYFPVWRGASYFIFYQWLLASVFLFLESTQINYKMILKFDNETLPRSKSLFFSAQIMTITFLVLSLLYMLQMTHIMNTNFQYFGHIMWLVLFIYYLIPIPFTNYHGTMYFLKLMFKIIISITPFIRCDPIIIWLSEQIVSFSQPFSDFGYTICKLQNINSQCLQIPNVTFIILVIFFSYRIIQNSRMVYQANWRIVPPFWGFWRALAGLITSITSYYYRKDVNNNSWLIIWIITAIISSLTASFVDFKGDWGLFNGQLLRKKLIFADKKWFYYISMIIDFCLRANWALNISPNIIKNFNILPYYLIMIISYLQLFRRCLWNIFRIENDHASNCDRFQAVINDTVIQNKVKAKYFQEKEQAKVDEKEEMRKKAQYQLVTTWIKIQSAQAENLDNFFHSNLLKVREINQKQRYFYQNYLN